MNRIVFLTAVIFFSMFFTVSATEKKSTWKGTYTGAGTGTMVIDFVDQGESLQANAVVRDEGIFEGTTRCKFVFDFEMKDMLYVGESVVFETTGNTSCLQRRGDNKVIFELIRLQPNEMEGRLHIDHTKTRWPDLKWTWLLHPESEKAETKSQTIFDTSVITN